MGLGDSNDRSRGNLAGALRVSQAYGQPFAPSERVRALTKENADLRSAYVTHERTIAMLSQQVGILKTNQQPKGDHMAEEFKSGDVVKLKSGGPKMTVRNRCAEVARTADSIAAAQAGYGYVTAGPRYDNPVTCDWFIGGEYEKSATFEAGSLRLVGDET